MKKTLLKTLLLTCLLSIWGVNAHASDVYSWNYSETSTRTNMSGYTNTELATLTYDNVTWNFTATTSTTYNNYSYYWSWSSGVQMGSSNLHHDNVTITSEGFAANAETEYAGTTITKVIVNARGGSNVGATISVKVGNTSFFYNSTEDTSASLTSTATDYEFDYAEGATGEIEIYYDQPTTSVALYFFGVDVYNADDKISPELAYSFTEVGADTNDYATVELPELTYAEDFDGVDEITYSSSNTDVAIVTEEGVVTLTGTIGKATITATFPGNDIYEAAEASYDINVEAAHTFNFEVHNYGLELHTDGNSSSYDTDPVTLEGYDGVTIDITLNEGSSGYRLWAGTSYNDFRAYSGVVLKFSAPNPMTEISFYCESSYVSNMTPDVGEYTVVSTTGTWTGNATEVTFTLTGQMRFRTIDVTQQATTGTFSISSAGYATYFTDAEYTMPEGVTGTTITGKETTTGDDGGYILDMTWDYVAGSTVPAETALLLKGSEGDYTYTITSTEATAPTDNLLLGSTQYVEETYGPNGETTGYVFYKLTYGSTEEHADVFGFYWGADDGAAFASPANKAWLAVPASQASNIKFFSLDGEGDTTGISTVESAEGASSDAIYTIQGIRVSNMNQPGLYIVDGKKVLVK